MLPEIIHAQQVVLLFKKRQIKHIVISPGSRNAPLTIGFTEDSFFTCYSIVDERCAGHVALGMAQQLREPVALLCTSGSALLNYYPAVTEAYYSEIPLIVLSADRPPHKIDIGDGQTIRQKHVYSNHILYDCELTMIHDKIQVESIATNERLLSKALNTTIARSGPVHINIPFEEPLYNRVEKSTIKDVKTIDILKEETSIIPDEFYKHWDNSSSKLIILSTLNVDVLTEVDLNKLTSDPSVLIMSEVGSNIRHDKVVWGIDTLIAPIENIDEEITHLQPDMVVTIGGMIVSKKIKQYLRKFETKIHYHVGKRRAYDTFFKLAGHIKVKPSTWVQSLRSKTVNSEYQQYWLKIFKNRIEKRKSYFETMPWCDFKVYKLLFQNLPDNILLQLGNSSTVRYAQLFPMNTSHKIYANRGTSGIDGSTSTAIGAAMASDRPCIFITGDLSFFYDSNALWNNYIPKNFKIIVINNSGGGIFRILPGHKDTHEFDTYFETKHDLTAIQLCEMYHIGYHKVGDEAAFAKAYQQFLSKNDKPQLLEIVTPSKVNDEILLNYFKFLR